MTVENERLNLHLNQTKTRISGRPRKIDRDREVAMSDVFFPIYEVLKKRRIQGCDYIRYVRILVPISVCRSFVHTYVDTVCDIQITTCTKIYCGTCRQ